MKYIAYAWKNAYKKDSFVEVSTSPISSGCKMSKDVSYEINWFDGDCVPHQLNETVCDSDITIEDSNFIEDVFTFTYLNADSNDDEQHDCENEL